MSGHFYAYATVRECLQQQDIIPKHKKAFITMMNTGSIETMQKKKTTPLNSITVTKA